MFPNLINPQLIAVIKRLEDEPKQGQSYEHMGRKGWQNPIRRDTGALLQGLVISTGAKRVLEIGTAHGLSGCYLLSALPKGGELHTIEWVEPTAKNAEKNFKEAGIGDMVTVYCGDALKIIDTLTGTFDLVFMDANKDGYFEQIKLLQQKGLLKPGATVLADNVTDREKEMQDFLAFMKDKSVIVPTECGLLVGKV